MANHIHIHLGSKVKDLDAKAKDATDPQELIRKYGIVEHRLGAFTPNAPLREKAKTRAELDALQKQLNALGYIAIGSLGSTRWQKAKDASTETEDTNSSDLQHKIRVVKEKLEAAKKANAPMAERQALMKEYEALLNELRKSRDAGTDRVQLKQMVKEGKNIPFKIVYTGSPTKLPTGEYMFATVETPDGERFTYSYDENRKAFYAGMIKSSTLQGLVNAHIKFVR